MKRFHTFDIVRPTEQWFKENRIDTVPDPTVRIEMCDELERRGVPDIGVVKETHVSRCSVKWIVNESELHYAWWDIDELQILGNAIDAVHPGFIDDGVKGEEAQ